MPEQAMRGEFGADQPESGWVRWLLKHAPFLVPSKEAEPDRRDTRYVKSFMVMRLGSGALAFLLPLLLVGIAALLDDETWRGSLSEYYYSGAREIFVGVLSATAVFLLAYKVIEVSLENVLSWIAAVLVVVVVVFPTKPPSKEIERTPLQDAIGEDPVKWIHFGAAGGFIVLLAVISFFFAVREARRKKSEHQGVLSPAFWGGWHLWWVTVILGAIAWLVGTLITAKLGVWEPSKAILIGEWVAIWAFAISWFTKGFEYHYLFRSQPGIQGSQPS
jgi:hypothetical protein